MSGRYKALYKRPPRRFVIQGDNHRPHHPESPHTKAAGPRPGSPPRTAAAQRERSRRGLRLHRPPGPGPGRPESATGPNARSRAAPGRAARARPGRAAPRLRGRPGGRGQRRQRGVAIARGGGAGGGAGGRGLPQQQLPREPFTNSAPSASAAESGLRRHRGRPPLLPSSLCPRLRMPAGEAAQAQVRGGLGVSFQGVRPPLPSSSPPRHPPHT